MSDYNMLAFSSQRSGRHEMEGLAHYSAGVTMDSMGQYPKALESYKKFLMVCKWVYALCCWVVCGRPNDIFGKLFGDFDSSLG